MIVFVTGALKICSITKSERYEYAEHVLERTKIHNMSLWGVQSVPKLGLLLHNM